MSEISEGLLKELVEVRDERKSQFIPYDKERYLKRREKELWSLAERWHLEQYEPDKFKAKIEAEAREVKRIDEMKAKRANILKKKKAA